MGEFQWPWQYNFPPFYTLQPNLDTQKKQVEAWCSLILEWHRHNKQYTMDVNECQNNELFYNKQIKRKLPLDAVYKVLEELRKRGNVEWTDKTRKQCMIMWRTPEEWGKLIYQYISNSGMTNTVCTLYELSNGDDTVDQEFHGLDMGLLKRALQSLEKQEKAEIIVFDDNEGVKFF